MQNLATFEILTTLGITVDEEGKVSADIVARECLKIHSVLHALYTSTVDLITSGALIPEADMSKKQLQTLGAAEKAIDWAGPLANMSVFEIIQMQVLEEVSPSVAPVARQVAVANHKSVGGNNVVSLFTKNKANSFARC